MMEPGGYYAQDSKHSGSTTPKRRKDVFMAPQPKRRRQQMRSSRSMVNIKTAVLNTEHLSVTLVGEMLAEVPIYVSTYIHLQHLDLQHNQLQRLPRAICFLGNLLTLKVGCNPLLSLPDDFGRLQNLRALGLSVTLIQDFPMSMREMLRLENIQLQRHCLTSFPKVFEHLPSLTALNMFGNVDLADGSLSDRGKQRLQASGLYGISGRNEKLRIHQTPAKPVYSAPPWIGNLKSMISLVLSANNITFIPRSIGALSHLEVLRLSFNKLSSLPKEIQHLKQLKVLMWNTVDNARTGN